MFIDSRLSRDKRSARLVEDARLTAVAVDLRLSRLLELAQFCARSPELIERIDFVTFGENCGRYADQLDAWVVVKETGDTHRQIFNSRLEISAPLPFYPREFEHQTLLRLENFTKEAGKSAISDVFTGIVYPAGIVTAGQFIQIADGRDVMVYVSLPARILSEQLKEMATSSGPMLGLVDSSKRIVARSNGIDQVMFDAVPAWFEPAMERGNFGASLDQAGPEAIGGTWDAGYYPLASASGWMAIAVNPSPIWFVSWSLFSLPSALISLGGGISLLSYAFLRFRRRVAKRIEATDTARFEAERANKEKSRLLATFAHDVRNPLISVIGSLEIVEASGEAAVEQIRAARLSAATLLALVDDILELSYLGSGQLSLRPSPVDLNQLAVDLVDQHQQSADAKDLALRLEIIGDLPIAVEIDRLRLHQVLSNLLNNAIKYTEAGAVTLFIRSERLQQDRVGLQFAVVDTGVGLLEDDLPCILREFGRLDRMAESVENGSGLGLAIVQRILRLMGTKLHIESKPGNGSRFEFKLIAPVIAHCVADVPMKPLDGLVIVYAEDEPVIRQVTSSQLREAGAVVIEAADGREAMMTLSTLCPDLLLLDLQMPNESGLEVVEKLRLVQTHSSFPIYVLTSHISGHAAEAAIAAGAQTVFTKPIQTTALAAAFYAQIDDKVSRASTSVSQQDCGSRALLDQENLLSFASSEHIENFSTLIAKIEASLSADLQKMGIAFASGDLEKVIELAHRSRGLCQVLGAIELANCFQGIETSATIVDAKQLASLLQRAIATLDATLQEVRQVRQVRQVARLRTH
jgi:signal transduction histidine kinase/DNA-binding NarL/FixJ family response regulator/HPt (histidine-containing phosphotransfer) domain-containing protein